MIATDGVMKWNDNFFIDFFMIIYINVLVLLVSERFTIITTWWNNQQNRHIDLALLALILC